MFSDLHVEKDKIVALSVIALGCRDRSLQSLSQDTVFRLLEVLLLNSEYAAKGMNGSLVEAVLRRQVSVDTMQHLVKTDIAGSTSDTIVIDGCNILRQ